MSKPRVCPNCRKTIPLDHGFSFDKQLNLICDRCNKIAVPASEAAENAAKPASTNSYHTYPGYSGGYSRHWQGNLHGGTGTDSYVGREE